MLKGGDIPFLIKPAKGKGGDIPFLIKPAKGAVNSRIIIEGGS